MTLLWVRTGNNGADPDVTIEDLGVVIPTGATWTALTSGNEADPFIDGYGQFQPQELRDSIDLYDLITAGTLEYSFDGVTEETETFDSEQVLADHLRNNDIDLTTGRLTLPNDINPPANIGDPRPGDLIYDTDDGYLVFYSGVLSQWITITDSGSVISDHGALAGLLDDDHPQYLLLSGNAARNPVTGTIDVAGGNLILTNTTDVNTIVGPTSGQIAFDSDDGYLLFYDGTSWVQVVDANTSGVTDHGALSGLLDDDHPQYLLLDGDRARNPVTGGIDVSDGYLTLPNYADPATQIGSPEIGDIAYDTDDGYVVVYNGTSWVNIGNGGDHGTLSGLLDDDHPQYGLLDGNAARNEVTGTYDFSDGYLIAPTYPSPPAVNVVDGEVAVVDGVLYAYDGTRSKWLSVDRKQLWGARFANNATNIYLRIQDGVVSFLSSYRALRDGTITGLVANTRIAETWTLEVRINGALSASATLSVTAATGAQDATIDVDFSAGDTIELYCSGNNISFPVGGVEIAWRV